MRQLPAVRTCWRSNRQERRRCDGTWDTCGPPTPGAPSLYLRGGDRSAALSRPAPGLRTRSAARPALGSESLKAEPPAAALLCSAPLLGNGGRACELNSSTDRQGSPWSCRLLSTAPVPKGRPTKTTHNEPKEPTYNPFSLIPKSPPRQKSFPPRVPGGSPRWAGRPSPGSRPAP